MVTSGLWQGRSQLIPSFSVNENREKCGSVQFKMVSTRLRKPIFGPPRLSEVFPVLPLKQFQCWSDGWWPFLVLSRKIVETCSLWEWSRLFRLLWISIIYALLYTWASFVSLFVSGVESVNVVVNMSFVDICVVLVNDRLSVILTCMLLTGRSLTDMLLLTDHLSLTTYVVVNWSLLTCRWSLLADRPSHCGRACC